MAATCCARNWPKPTELELSQELPLLLDQLGKALLLAKACGKVTHDSISKSAIDHSVISGGTLTVKRTIHDYGDLCKVVTELAIEWKAPISIQEFVALDLCLDEAIARAVAESGDA